MTWQTEATGAFGRSAKAVSETIDAAPVERNALVRSWQRTSKLDPRYLIAFLITLVLVAAQLRYHMLGSYDRLVLALGVCLATEAVLSWFERGKVVNLLSAYISGISLTLLVKPQGGALCPFALGGFLAISSKYVLRYRENHLWNPTNFAITALLLAAPDRVSVLRRWRWPSARRRWSRSPRRLRCRRSAATSCRSRPGPAAPAG